MVTRALCSENRGGGKEESELRKVQKQLCFQGDDLVRPWVGLNAASGFEKLETCGGLLCANFCRGFMASNKAK